MESRRVDWSCLDGSSSSDIAGGSGEERKSLWDVY